MKSKLVFSQKRSTFLLSAGIVEYEIKYLIKFEISQCVHESYFQTVNSIYYYRADSDSDPAVYPNSQARVLCMRKIFRDKGHAFIRIRIGNPYPYFKYGSDPII
jgi:hypothetical protein